LRTRFDDQARGEHVQAFALEEVRSWNQPVRVAMAFPLDEVHGNQQLELRQSRIQRRTVRTGNHGIATRDQHCADLTLAGGRDLLWQLHQRVKACNRRLVPQARSMPGGRRELRKHFSQVHVTALEATSARLVETVGDGIQHVSPANRECRSSWDTPVWITHGAGARPKAARRRESPGGDAAAFGETSRGARVRDDGCHPRRSAAQPPV
jgi:hypothetical protein